MVAMARRDDLFLRETIILKENRAERYLVQLHELHQQVVEIPWAARNVEDRVELAFVGAALQSSVERTDPRKSNASSRTLRERGVGRLQQVPRIRNEDRIVDIAD